jgi:hypothetical protein
MTDHGHTMGVLEPIEREGVLEYGYVCEIMHVLLLGITSVLSLTRKGSCSFSGILQRTWGSRSPRATLGFNIAAHAKHLWHST